MNLLTSPHAHFMWNALSFQEHHRRAGIYTRSDISQLHTYCRKME